MTDLGFGDIIPGSRSLYKGFANNEAAKTLGITSVYIIFGMAILGLATELADYEIKKMAHLIRKIFSRGETSVRANKVPINYASSSRFDSSRLTLSGLRTASSNRVSPSQA